MEKKSVCVGRTSIENALLIFAFLLMILSKVSKIAKQKGSFTFIKISRNVAQNVVFHQCDLS